MSVGALRQLGQPGLPTFDCVLAVALRVADIDGTFEQRVTA